MPRTNHDQIYLREIGNTFIYFHPGNYGSLSSERCLPLSFPLAHTPLTGSGRHEPVEPQKTSLIRRQT